MERGWEGERGGGGGQGEGPEGFDHQTSGHTPSSAGGAGQLRRAAPEAGGRPAPASLCARPTLPTPGCALLPPLRRRGPAE